MTLDKAGFRCLYLGEHHFSNYSTYSNSLLMIAHLAAKTQRLHFGTSVCTIPLHHPVNLAEDVNLLDNLTEGRFVFGVGSGGIPFEGMGFGQEPDGAHSNRMIEVLNVVFELWELDDAQTEKTPFTFKTTHYSGKVVGRINPSPFTKPYPVIKRACQSPSGVRQAARNGWAALMFPAFMGMDHFGVIREWWDLYRRELDSSGHPDWLVERCLEWTSPFLQVQVADTPERAMQGMVGGMMSYMGWVRNQMELERVHLGRNPVADGMGGPAPGEGPPPPLPEKGLTMGTAETVAKGLRDYADLGFRETIVGFGMGTFDAQRRAEKNRLIDRFAAEVMPLL